MKKKRFITTIFGLLTVLCSALAINTTQQSTVKAAENVFEMTTGGSIRVVEPYGLRFQVKMSEDIKETAGKVGMLIFPADYLVDSGEEGDIYYESVEALAATTVSGHRINLDLTAKLYEEDGYWYGNGAIVNIKDKNMSREFVGIAYYEVNGTKVWVDTSKISDTTRSAVDVALLTYADETKDYDDAYDILTEYMGYMKDTGLENIHLDSVPLAVDNGSDNAVSRWSAEYVDGGVKIYVTVEDEISIDENDIGMSDNVEFQMQAVDNYVQTDGYTVNMLCNGEGKYWLRRWSTGTGWVSEEVSVDISSENDSVYCLYEKTDNGYKAEFFVSYEMLRVTEEEAKGNVRILPMLRNRTDSEHNSFSALDLFGSQYDYPSTWFVLDEDNCFTRKDLNEISLTAVSTEAEEMLSNLAEISSDYDIYTAEEGAPAFSNSIWCLDALPYELYGIDYVRGPKGGGETVTVEESGYVIILCSGTNTTMLEQLKTDGWTLLNDKARCALSVTAGTDNNFQYLSSFYGKYFEKEETFAVSGEYAVVFAKASETPTQFSWKTTPAYISFEAASDEYYSAEKNVFNGQPSIAATNGGRLIAAYVTGGTFEPDYENSVVIAYSDDSGETWTKAFVIDSWVDQEINGTKEDIVLEADLRVDPETNILYVIYNLRMNRDSSIVMNTGTWLFTVDNIDEEVSNWKVGEQTEIGMCFVKNTFTILSDGRFAIIPNGYMNSEANYIYFSSDKGKTWVKGGSIYVPQAFNFDEPVLVEKQDGILWALFRTTLGVAYESFSYDGGETWTVGQATDIKNPCARFNITRLASGNLIMVYNDSSSGRLGMMAAISEDDGETWNNKLCVYDGYASYPAIALSYEDGVETINIIFDDNRYYGSQWRTSEDGTVQYYSGVYHYSFTEEELFDGGDPSDEEIELLVAGDSYTNPTWWTGFESSFGTYGGESVGIGGTRVDDWNNTEKIAEIVAKNPKNLFINLGINNIGTGTDGEALGNALVAYLEALKTALPNTTIYYNMIVYPSNTNYSYDEIDTSNEIVEAYIDGDTEDNVNKIDIREKLMLNGEVDSTKFSDGLHLSGNGYAILADAIKEATGIGIRVNELNAITRAERRVFYDFESVEYASLGQIGGTNTNVFDTYIAIEDGYLYFKAETSATIDESLSEGIDFFVHFGNQTYTTRTENTYNFQLYTKGGLVTGSQYYYPNDVKTSASGLANVVFRKMVVDDGVTTLYGVLPLSSLYNVDLSKVSVCMTSVMGSAYDTWTYKNQTVNRFMPLYYPVLHEDNKVSKDLTKEEFQTLVEATSAYQSEKTVFENIAAISTTGTMETINNGDCLFSDCTTQNWVFDADLPDFMFGMAYAYNPLTTGNFTVETAGYVILLVPGGDNYSSFRTTVEDAGFVKVLSEWNRMGSLSEPSNFYIKWCEANESYSFGKWSVAIANKSVYVCLGSIGGTNTNVFNAYIGQEDGCLYFKVETSATIDTTVAEGVDLFVHFGNQVYTARTADTYCFNLYTKNDLATGGVYYYPSNAKTSADESVDIERWIVVKNGVTSIYGKLRLNSLQNVDTSKISVCMTSVKGTAFDTWTYKSQTVDRFKPLYYPVLHADNTVSKDLTTEEFQTLVKTTSAYQNEKPVFENIATISTTGTMGVLDTGDFMFSDRTTQNYVFDANLPDFMFGMSYAYNGIASGNFTVEKSGYVILILPGGSSYSSIRTTAEGEGFVKILSDWNKMGSLPDACNYYIKWCEVGETYSFGKWNIAIADALSISSEE